MTRKQRIGEAKAAAVRQHRTHEAAVEASRAAGQRAEALEAQERQVGEEGDAAEARACPTPHPPSPPKAGGSRLSPAARIAPYRRPPVLPLTLLALTLRRPTGRRAGGCSSSWKRSSAASRRSAFSCPLPLPCDHAVLSPTACCLTGAAGGGVRRERRRRAALAGGPLPLPPTPSLRGDWSLRWIILQSFGD